jgi:hypothetical protein
MSFHEYMVSRELAAADPPLYALIMAAIRKADTRNMAKLQALFPQVVAEFEDRYNAPGGKLESEIPTSTNQPNR